MLELTFEHFAVRNVADVELNYVSLSVRVLVRHKRRPSASTNSIPASLPPGVSLTKAKLAGPSARRPRPFVPVRDSRRRHQ
jgi:hypothetical protein